MTYVNDMYLYYLFVYPIFNYLLFSFVIFLICFLVVMLAMVQYQNTIIIIIHRLSAKLASFAQTVLSRKLSSGH
jgi:hypothetical protein